MHKTKPTSLAGTRSKKPQQSHARPTHNKTTRPKITRIPTQHSSRTFSSKTNPPTLQIKTKTTSTSTSDFSSTMTPPLGTDATPAPIVIRGISTNADQNVFSNLPPAPLKTAQEDQIPDLPNYINSEYANGRKPIMSLTLEELTASIQQLGLPKFRAKQIFSWVYQSGATDFSEMRNISTRDQDLLKENFFIYPLDLKYVATASDATRKYVFQVEKKAKKIDTIESVFIPRIWNRLYGLNDNDRDHWDIPVNGPGPDASDNENESAPYDVSTFLDYQKQYRAHLVKTGKLHPSYLQNSGDDTLNNSSDLNIIPNSALAESPSSLESSASALVNSATSIANSNNGKASEKNGNKTPLPLNQRKNGHLFIPDFLQTDPNNKNAPIHTFDNPLYQYEKGAVCFSSQIGCSLACTFCHTGTIDKTNVRNLSTGEIIGQIMAIKQDLSDFKGRRPHLHGEQNEPGTIVSSVVGMGQGEPFYNINALLRSISILNSPDGLNMGRRHITISTSGVVTGIDKLAETFPVNLAISLHAVTDELRSKIMPINKIFNLEALMDSIRRYPAVKKTRLVTFEYIMLGGVNDSEADARELLRLVKGIPSLVNLIPFNDWPGCGLESSSMNRIRKFQEIINSTTFQTGVRCTVRSNRGNDQLGACGTLNSQLSGSLLKYSNAKAKGGNAANLPGGVPQLNEQVNLAHIVREATKL